MSTSRRNQDSGQARDLVFCHECENEFYKEKNSPGGLTCPECRSDFTEIIEQDFDPRAAQEPEHPLHSHNPWAAADDPDEEDIGNIQSQQFGYGQGSGMGGFRQGQFQQNTMQHPVFGDFMFMLNNMAGGRGMPPLAGNTNMPGREGPGAFRPRSAPGMRQEGQQTRVIHHGPNGGYTMTVDRPGFHSTSYVSGNARMGGAGAQGGPIPMGDISEILGPLLGMPFGAMQGGARGTGAPTNPFGAIFSSIFDPANARSGDAVFSQEALDRVISQLMEQNPGGSAPGPASASAIDSLPRKTLSVDMLDENTGHAECAICMDNVDIGEEITTLPCKHWFHFPCVEAWLKEHDTCPVCRRGIMAKDGPRDRVRGSDQAPLHDEDPVELGRRQSGTRDNPFVVDESPTRDRRRQRPSSSGGTNAGGSGSGGGITDRVRSFFGGSGSSA